MKTEDKRFTKKKTFREGINLQFENLTAQVELERFRLEKAKVEREVSKLERKSNWLH